MISLAFLSKTKIKLLHILMIIDKLKLSSTGADFHRLWPMPNIGCFLIKMLRSFVYFTFEFTINSLLKNVSYLDD